MLFEQMFWVSSKIHHKKKMKTKSSKRGAEKRVLGRARLEGGVGEDPAQTWGNSQQRGASPGRPRDWKKYAQEKEVWSI